MEVELLNDALLRDFLLGKLDEEVQDQLEDAFLVDPQAKEKVLLAEHDLVEEYLEGSLTSDDKERFLARYAQTPEQRRDLQIAASIKDYAVREAAKSQSIANSVSSSNNLLAGSRLKSYLIPAMVAIVIAIITAVVWLNVRNRSDGGLEQELAKLNSPQGINEVATSNSLDVLPVNVRGGSKQAELKQDNGSGVVELRLLWIEKEAYSTYQARIRKVGDTTWHTVPALRPKSNGGGSFIPLRVPANRLLRGTYQIELSGVNSNGSLSPSIEYVLTITD
jgi:hypothetical protein